MSWQLQSGCVREVLKSAILFLFLLFSVEFTTIAADPREYAVEISVDVLTGPFALQLNWPANEAAREYVVRRRTPGHTVWGEPIATLPSSATGYTDFSVSDGVAYEYEVRMELNVRGNGGEWLSGYGYVYAAGNLPPGDEKGKALLVVDASVSSPLANELATFQNDLIASGWTVVRRDVSRTSSPAAVRDQIIAEHNADPFSLRSVVLIGHVPVPYSGNIAPDLHETHRGAWPADGFYGEVNGTWTDSTVNVDSFDDDENDNRPGDGKFDQSVFPGAVDLEVGRIDFWNLPAFGARTEVELLRNYFRKNHQFRTRGFTAARKGLIRDNFGDLDGDAPAVDAWRHFPQFFGPGNITEVGPGGFFSTLANESFLWAYGCGGGGYVKADGVGTTSEFAASDPKAVFLVLHGSYFGDWNNSDNFLRAAIATPNYTLASIWSGLPHWFMHPMGLGATIGYCTRLSQNNVSDYKSYINYSANEAHIALIGDPTLEMFPVVPPGNLSASAGPAVVLNWNAAAEESVAGYHVYYSTSANGPFQRITSTPVTGTSFSHNIGAGTYHYLVRTLKLERTGSGTFYNLSQGAMASITQGNGGGVPAVSISTPDADAGESGANQGEFRLTRSIAADYPLTIELLVGGTALNGVDYQALPASVTIPAGSGEARLALVPIADTLSEGEETVTVQIRPNANYTVGSPSVGFLRIADAAGANRSPLISQVADQSMNVNSSLVVNFQISDAETNPDSLNVRGLSSNTALVTQTGLVFGGSGFNRTLRVTPVVGATGTSTITLLVSDGIIESSRTFEVTVVPVNLAPSAQPQSLSAAPGRPLSIILSGTDPEEAPLTFTVRSNPTKGMLGGAAPNLTYTATASATGQDSFTFSVSDGQTESTPAAITIQIAATNGPPTAVSQEVQTDEDTAVGIALSASDPDGDDLQFEIVSGTTKGVLSGRDRNYNYTPVANATGNDSFSFRVSDGEAVSALATVAIVIRSVNDAPIATSTNVQVLEDQTIPITLGATDPDRDPVTFQLLTSPTKGQITGTPPNLTFMPALNAAGADSFTFKVSDGLAESSIATVSLLIVASNDPPTAVGQSITTAEDVPVSVGVGGSDPDGDALTFRVVTAPARGSLSGAPPNLLYTPVPDTNGADSFAFVVNDGRVDSAPATVSIQVDPRNDPPTVDPIVPQFVRKNGATVALPLVLHDPDRPINELLVTASSSHETVVTPANIRFSGEGINRALTATPEPGATGTTIITIVVSDGEAQAQSSFLLTVTNTPPVASADALAVPGGSLDIPAGQLLSNDSDADGDALRIVSISPSQTGQSLTLTNDVIVYRGAGVEGDSFDYVMEDTSGAKATGRVTLTFQQAPRIEEISVSGDSITLRVAGPSSRIFRVRTSTDALTWTVTGEGTTDANGRGEYRESRSSALRLYRIEWP